LHFNLPVIVERNACTMPQERYNADWLVENDAGIVLENFDTIAGAVKKLLDGSTLERLRANICGRKNHAVYEAVEILTTLMDQPSVGRHHDELPALVR
jgi:1,2-diacylglycerol 3-beta-galactosyltransferase